MQPSSEFHPLDRSGPLHVGIIPDGGRRWALARACSLEQSYLRTSEILEEAVDLFIGKGVKEISIYLSSIQNFRRGSTDLSPYLDVVEAALNNRILNLAGTKNLRLTISGNRHVLPPSLSDACTKAETLTRHHQSGKLNLLIAYDPHLEIAEALRLSGSPEEYLNCLTVSTPLDLVIRSGGANLLSNFLPLQSGYARLYFIPSLFNDLCMDDFEKILNEFAGLERKFGE